MWMGSCRSPDRRELASEKVTQFVTFGLEIAQIVGIRLYLNGDLLGNLQTVAFEANDFARIIGQQPDGL
jgi:hypothetical protein